MKDVEKRDKLNVQYKHVFKIKLYHKLGLDSSLFWEDLKVSKIYRL